jgi:hypothetical protein
VTAEALLRRRRVDGEKIAIACALHSALRSLTLAFPEPMGSIISWYWRTRIPLVVQPAHQVTAVDARLRFEKFRQGLCDDFASRGRVRAGVCPRVGAQETPREG